MGREGGVGRWGEGGGGVEGGGGGEGYHTHTPQVAGQSGGAARVVARLAVRPRDRLRENGSDSDGRLTGSDR